MGKMVSPAEETVASPPAILVPVREKLKTLIYQLFANSRQGRDMPGPAADTAGAAIRAGWFTAC